MPAPSFEGELLARALNEELHDVVAPDDLATSIIERHRHSRRSRRAVLGPLVASVAAVAVVLALVVPTIDDGATTPRWTLVGDIIPSWRETPSQGLTQSFSLTCPSTTTCYVPGFSGVEATRDAGKTWAIGASVPMPVFYPWSPVTCVNASTCAVLARSSSNLRLMFMDTADAGSTWVTRPAPSWLSSWYPPGATSFGPLALSCSTATTCSLVANDSTGTLARAFVTSDRGRTWSSSRLPPGSSYSKLWCSTSGHCILAGLSGLAYSTDGGRTWSTATGYSRPWIPDFLSCSDASHCMVVVGPRAPTGAPWVGVSNDGGRTWSTATDEGMPGGEVWGLSCPTSADCWASAGGPNSVDPDGPPSSWPGAVIVSTTNAGATWQRDALPPGVGNVQGVSCPRSNMCYALAWSQESAVLIAYRS